MTLLEQIARSETRKRRVKSFWVLTFSLAAGYFEYRYTHSLDAGATMTFALFAVTEAIGGL